MKKQTLFLLLFLISVGGLLAAVTASNRSLPSPSEKGKMAASPQASQTRKNNAKIEDRKPVANPAPQSGVQTIQQTSPIVQVEFQPKAEGRSAIVRLIYDAREIRAQEAISSPTGAVQCVFEPLNAGVSYTVVASASDYLPTQQTVALQESGNTVSLVLYPHPILSLQINNEESAPIPGAAIELRSQSQGIYSVNLQTNEKGAAEIELPYPGDYDLIASHPLYSESAHKVLRVDGNPNRQTIVLSGKTGLIFGKASDISGQVVANASVVLFGTSKHNQLAKTQTGEDGGYRFAALPLTAYYVQIDAGDAYIDSDIEYTIKDKRDALIPHVVLTPERPSAEVNFQVSPATLVHGVVVDSTNSPIAGAEIKAGIQGNRPTSIRPVFKEIKSNAQGEFTFPIKTRVRGWTTLLISAVHPEYGDTTESLANYIEKYHSETVVLKLEKRMGSLNASVVAFISREPIPSIEIKLIPYAFRGDERYHKKVAADAKGNFQLALSEGNYIAKADGYSIQSPQSININADRETLTTIFVEKDDEKKVTVSGIVVNQDHAPIHGAQVYISAGDRTAGQTESSPEGKFQFEVNESDLQEDRVLSVYHRLYQIVETPISEIPDLGGVAVVLKENPGAVKVVMTGIDGAQGIKLNLTRVNALYESREEEALGQTTVFLRGIDENKGPFYIMAGGENYAGISPIFDLRDNPSRFLEVEIPMHSIDSKASMAVQVVDAKTGEPIEIATCEIEGSTFNPAGIPSMYKRRAITMPGGVATLPNVPQCVGTLHIRHVFYQEISVPFYHDGVNSDRVLKFQLTRREEG